MNDDATIVLPADIANRLATITREPLETAGVLLAGVARTENGVRLLVRELHLVPEDQYSDRRGDALLVRSGGYVPALARAAEIGAVALWFHTHPEGDPTPSSHDASVDEQLDAPFRIRTGQDSYGSIVLSPGSDLFQYTGCFRDGNTRHAIGRAWVVGPRFRLLSAFDASSAHQAPALYDRQVRAFGGDVQAVLDGLTVAVIGCGGTGSAVVEQLARLGVGSVLLVDPDTVEATNLTRLYGSSPSSVGQPKAEVLASHVAAIALDVTVRSIVGRLTEQSVAQAVTAADVVFGCTDDNAGRQVLSRLSTFYMVPVIDCGVLLDSTDGTLRGIYGRVTVMAPGYACLICRNRVDLARAAAELLDPEERRQRQDEGYAPELGRVEPAVVSYTSLVASLATAELLERLVGYGVTPAPSEILVRAHDREVSTNSRPPRDGHFCDPAAGLIGYGDTEPFMQVTWVQR